MVNPFIETITGAEPGLRDRALGDLVGSMTTAEVLRAAEELEAFRTTSRNLYERVRASIFLHSLYRYRIQDAPDLPASGVIPFDGFTDLMERRFEQAIAAFRAAIRNRGDRTGRWPARWRRLTSG